MPVTQKTGFHVSPNQTTQLHNLTFRKRADKRMKALTTWQPWASLLACGAKQFETRGWATSYRGPIAIHAADISISRVLKAVFPLGKWSYAPDYEAEQRFLTAVGRAFGNISVTRSVVNYLSQLPRGAVIATGELVGCHKVVSVGWTGSSERRIAWTDGELTPHYPLESELLFGDWTPGRYAWEISDVKMLPEPVPAKGKQRLWNWEAS